MAVVSIGTDLVPIERLGQAIERRGQALLDRLFGAAEQDYCEARPQRLTHYAGRFAVKEAVMKVLGTGWGQGVRWVDIEVARQDDSAPELLLHGESARIAKAAGIRKIHITISHAGGLALAFAVAED
ncbi:MAG: holo-ACP synthase [bacterium]|nr:holo-[acyl-carrier-protein] synthase [Planctomycetota bacterium]HIL51889.1 holo-[acyl-carrier-protein] synthase [Planctomycetota bacterium]